MLELELLRVDEEDELYPLLPSLEEYSSSSIPSELISDSCAGALTGIGIGVDFLAGLLGAGTGSLAGAAAFFWTGLDFCLPSSYTNLSHSSSPSSSLSNEVSS